MHYKSKSLLQPLLQPWSVCCVPRFLSHTKTATIAFVGSCRAEQFDHNPWFVSCNWPSAARIPIAASIPTAVSPSHRPAHLASPRLLTMLVAMARRHSPNCHHFQLPSRPPAAQLPPNCRPTAVANPAAPTPPHQLPACHAAQALRRRAQAPRPRGHARRTRNWRLCCTPHRAPRRHQPHRLRRGLRAAARITGAAHGHSQPARAAGARLPRGEDCLYKPSGAPVLTSVLAVGRWASSRLEGGLAHAVLLDRAQRADAGAVASPRGASLPRLPVWPMRSRSSSTRPRRGSERRSSRLSWWPRRGRTSEPSMEPPRAAARIVK